jgi:two-component system, chemotaxis family, protein-glutamate methylesterase/glutaminase
VPPIRVLVVDDAAVMRRLVSDIIGDDPDFEVVGTAANGRLAVDKITQVQPDVMTLDVEMPVLDGLGTLREMRERRLRVPTVMFSTLTERGAEATLDALALGASDYVAKPSNTGSFAASRERVREELLPKLRSLGRRAVPTGAELRASTPRRTGRRSTCELVAIGCSTGGPNALADVLPALPSSLVAPIVITQHMPPVFTGLLAKRLDGLVDRTVVEAEHGMPVQARTVYLAPGDHHLTVHARGDGAVLHLDQSPPENSCRPAVDPMFRSVASVYGDRALGVVLTGMGHDGLAGARWLVEAGSHVIVQDEASSVVWGMPGAVAAAGLADAVLPLDDVAAAIGAAASAGLARST